MTRPAFRTDDEYDQANGDYGGSRFANYIRGRAAMFSACWDGTYESSLAERFAVMAWDVATGPIMIPGYVRQHRRIMAADPAVSDWDGSLVARVDLITCQPRNLSYVPNGGGFWRDWPAEASWSGDGDLYAYPSGEDLTRSGYLLTSVSLQFALPAFTGLPAAPVATPSLRELADTARTAVRVLARELSAIVDPVIAIIDGD